MSRLRRKLSERLVAVKNETAMLTTFNEVDMQQIFDLRESTKILLKRSTESVLDSWGFLLKPAHKHWENFLQ